MTVAIIAAAFVVVAAIVGMALKPTEDQLKPLTPQASSADDHGHGHDSHHH
jgi:hypothetical protein